MAKSILTPDQHFLLGSISKTPEIIENFYFTGGTALAEYYFQHRLSEDLDFFTERHLDETALLLWAKTLATHSAVTEIEYKTLHGQITFFIHFAHSVVKVDFAYYPFPHLGQFLSRPPLRISSLEDIGVNKLQAIQSRLRGRDFVDLYFILNQGKLKLPDLIKSYKNKFDLTLSPLELAKHFAAVTTATDQPRFLGNVSWQNIEEFFLNQAKILSKDIFA